MTLPKRDKYGKFISAKASKPSNKPSKKPKLTAQQIASKSSKTSSNLPTTHAAMVIDCSGSMQGIWPTTLSELKRNVNTIRGESIRTGQGTTLTATAFGSHVKALFTGEPIQDAKLPENLYPNMGWTALYDAVDSTIERLSKLPSSDETSFIVIVLTDGEENQSRVQANELRNMIQRLQRTDRWSFAFLVPPGQKSLITTTLGLPSGNVVEWEQTDRGARTASASVTRGLSSYYSMRSSGQRSTKGFFTTDLSKVDASAVKRKLVDISKEVKIWPVPRETTIQDFVEDKLGTGRYVLGSAYYQLSKDELVESTKDILVAEKGKKTIYGGYNARTLLGLPTGDVKLRPGNHANLDIFVQSRSVNRKLVRGTKLVVRV